MDDRYDLDNIIEPDNIIAPDNVHTVKPGDLLELYRGYPYSNWYTGLMLIVVQATGHIIVTNTVLPHHSSFFKGDIPIGKDSDIVQSQRLRRVID